MWMTETKLEILRYWQLSCRPAKAFEKRLTKLISTVLWLDAYGIQLKRWECAQYISFRFGTVKQCRKWIAYFVISHFRLSCPGAMFIDEQQIFKPICWNWSGRWLIFQRGLLDQAQWKLYGCMSCKDRISQLILLVSSKEQLEDRTFLSVSIPTFRFSAPW